MTIKSYTKIVHDEVFVFNDEEYSGFFVIIFGGKEHEVA